MPKVCQHADAVRVLCCWRCRRLGWLNKLYWVKVSRQSLREHCALAAWSQYDAKPLRAHELHPSDMCVIWQKTWVKRWGRDRVIWGEWACTSNERDDVEIEKSGGREMRRGEKWRGEWWGVKIRGDWERITWGQGVCRMKAWNKRKKQGGWRALTHILCFTGDTRN